MAKRNAFTLAEVLITLGIIGVVAAMTMPTLLANTQQQQFRAQLKKSMTVLTQAASINLAIDDYDAATATESGVAADKSNLYSLYKKRTNVVSTGTSQVGAWAASSTAISGAKGIKLDGLGGAIILNYNDGSSFAFSNGANGTSCQYDGTDGNPQSKIVTTKNKPADFTKVSGMCVGFIDVNGPKAPNLLADCDTQGADRGTKCKVTKTYDVYPVLIDGSNMYPANAATESFYKNQK